MKVWVPQSSILLIVLTLFVAEFGLHFGQARVYAAPPTQPPENQMEQWEKEAQARVDLRQKGMRDIINFFSKNNHKWQASESIMSQDSTLRYIESINNLDLKYPWAIPETEKNYREVSKEIRGMNVKKRGPNARAKKNAAFRYLRQKESKLSFLGTGLHSRQVLSLAWAAIHDKSVFPSQMEVEDRTWGLLEALANIQRAHNECPETGAIQWDWWRRDKKSCETGRFKRLLEHLDNLHPSVHLNSAVSQIAVQDIVRAIRQEHQRLRKSLSSTECQNLKKSFQSSNRVFYQEYVDQLIQEVHTSNPSISLEQIKEQTGQEMMDALFDAPEWADCFANLKPAVQGGDPFAALGSPYQMGKLIWSGIPRGEPRRGFFGIGRRESKVRTMSWAAADRFCRNLGNGARLPTREELEALAKVLGYPDHYQPLSEMRDTWFWSSSENFLNFGFYWGFEGSSGNSYSGFHKDNDSLSVRCVRVVQSQ